MSHIDKCSMVRDIVQNIGQLIEIENKKNTGYIQLHIITFCSEANHYKKNKDENIDDFIVRADILPSDTTDFIEANECFEEVVSTLPNNVTSLFLSDGRHRNDDVIFTQLYDYTIGIGDFFDVDTAALEILGKECYVSDIQKDVEDIIIGSIFTDVCKCYEDVKISVIVPNSSSLFTTLEHKQKFTNDLFTDDLPVTNEFKFETIASEHGASIIISSNINYKNAVDKDIILSIDKSGSMSDYIYQNPLNNRSYDIPSPDIRDYNTQVIIEEVEESDDEVEESDDEVEESDDEESDSKVEVSQDISSFKDLASEHVHNVDDEYADSVFDRFLSIDDYKYIQYDFENISLMDRYFQDCMTFDDLEDDEKIYIKISNGDNHTINVFTKSDFIVTNKQIVYKDLTYLSFAIEKIGKLEKCKLRSDYIHELYSHITNTTWHTTISEIIDNDFDSDDIMVHKYAVVIDHINMLYHSIVTVGQAGHNYYNNNDRDLLEKKISTRMCRSLTQTQTQPTENNSVDVAVKECIICCDKTKSVLYTCGHALTCEDCTQYLLFGPSANKPALNGSRIYDRAYDKKCPACRAEISGYVVLDTTNFACKSEGCIMTPTIICTECLEPVFCRSCFNKELRQSTKTRTMKRKRIGIMCNKGHVFENYIEAIF